MAVPLFNSFTTISHNTNKRFNPISTFDSLKHSSIYKIKKWISCASTDSNPLSLEAGVWLDVGTHLIPHPNKVEKGGEDAFFVCSHGGGVIAVADGVSGWAEKDVDPALFSRQLMANASSLVVDGEVNYNPRNLIRKAHAATSTIGSATVVVAMLERNGTLKIANVGDCGVRVIRKGRVTFSTSPQEHYFDCPYQLSSEAVGQTFIDATVSHSSTRPRTSSGFPTPIELGFQKNSPTLSHFLVFLHIFLLSGSVKIQVTSIELMEEDTVVMGSDGLFDNLFDQEIISVVGSCDNVSDAAKTLANLAHIHSKDSSFESPYSLEARVHGFDVPWWKKLLGMKLTGGKLDDITVIVGQVKSSMS